MDNPLDLSGRVAIVTGGGKGVGRGITERLLEAVHQDLLRRAVRGELEQPGAVQEILSVLEL